MRDTLILVMPGQEGTALALGSALPAARVETLQLHRFPDGEVLVTLPEVAGREVLLFSALDQAEQRLLPLLFAADAARAQGALRVGLIAPYLAYMRQDRQFHAGEAVTSRTFAALLSRHLDFLVTVDPHLHRYPTLAAIYDMPALAVASAPAIARWIKAEVSAPLLVGPDEESSQWINAIAALAGAPAVVLSKVRRGDFDVEVSLPDAGRWQGRTPVLVDDIVSSARTMIAAVGSLRQQGLPAPVCIAVHALFAGDAYAALQAAGPAQVLSCNTVMHASNGIDVMPEIAAALASRA